MAQRRVGLVKLGGEEVLDAGLCRGPSWARSGLFPYDSATIEGTRMTDHGLLSRPTPGPHRIEEKQHGRGRRAAAGAQELQKPLDVRVGGHREAT